MNDREIHPSCYAIYSSSKVHCFPYVAESEVIFWSAVDIYISLFIK